MVYFLYRDVQVIRTIKIVENRLNNTLAPRGENFWLWNRFFNQAIKNISFTQGLTQGFRVLFYTISLHTGNRLLRSKLEKVENVAKNKVKLLPKKSNYPNYPRPAYLNNHCSIKWFWACSYDGNCHKVYPSNFLDLERINLRQARNCTLETNKNRCFI